MRIFTGKCAISQTGSGSGYIQVSITNFNDPGGQFDTTEIQVGDKVVFTDSGDIYKQDITEVVSASGATATVKVTNVGVSSIPTTTNAFVSRGSVNYSLFPFVANTSFNENQLFLEDTMAVIDDALDTIAGGGGGPTNLTFTGAGPINLNSSTGTGVTLTAGSGVTLTRVSNNLTIAASGGGGATDLTLTGTNPVTLNSSTGTDVTFTPGTNVAFSRVGNDLTISAPAAVTGVLDQANGLDIANSGGTITVAPNISELSAVVSYDGNDMVMVYDNSTGTHGKAVIGTYLGGGFVDLVNNQVNIAGTKGFTTALQRGNGSLPTGSTFGSTTATIFALKGVTTMTDSNFSTFGGATIHSFNDGINNISTVITSTGDSTPSARSGSLVFRTSNGAAPFVNAVKINPAGRLMTMRGSGVTGSSGGDIIVGSSGLGFESGPVDYVWKSTSTSGQEFVLLEAGGAKCYTGVGSSQWTFPSDQRLKQNIHELSVLDKIHLLKGVTYELKTDGIPQVGVIAQDIQSAFPEGVRQDENGTLGVGAMTVAAIALQGVKELYEENKMLKQQLQDLLGRVEALENK